MRDWVTEKILPKVEKPTRYLGTEWNAVHKPWDDVAVKMAFAFPDVYEVGMSHLGLRILYGLVNEQKDMLMERVFAPWVDMEEMLRQYNLPLFTLESYRPLSEFDVVGFTLQYEMSYTNVLNMLNLAGIPLRSIDRTSKHPLIIAGGPCALNPEPLADFIDIFLLGESEELLLEVLAVIKKNKKNGLRADRDRVMEEVVKIPGVYVPAFYDVTYQEGKFKKIEPNRPGVPKRIKKRVVADLDKAYFPTNPIVPFMEIVHDRIMLEVLRGCTRGCRFCQAGIIYRPVRERSPQTLLKQAEELVRKTGHDEISLTSLSTTDYSCIEPLINRLVNIYGEQGVGISLPSLRADAFSVGLAEEIQRVRKTGLTFAPEAGTQRLRDVINKGVTEEALLEAAQAAFSAGWTSIKLYFMIGLPTETEKDLEGIAELARKVVELGQKTLKEQGVRKRVKVTVSVSSFVPKPHTPLQWEPQDEIEVLKKKQSYLKSLLRDRHITYNWHAAEVSFLEAVFAKGDRQLGKVLEAAWRKGCKFDSWTEHFRFQSWLDAFKECNVDPGFYAHRKIKYDEVLPWDHIDVGVTKKYLIREHQKALRGEITGDCRFVNCPGCGICSRFGVAVVQKGGDTRNAAVKNRIY
ncbi:TIGR03960 family B12-binding radical SAM protein [Calderihabitans maritimus]|uniref:Radical SAM protein n=1 Tax=Calderihabitans maritimus TaxID=1246530 RepID=A0A1Z5HV93_9FIRM|nr:TIGR03960 family B12-binding radical SAM protein [Calderihabitans maritimus]GAW93328.1 radical SAM protein [Calderihabitans maritimus]